MNNSDAALVDESLLGGTWTGPEMVEWLKFEDSLKPPIMNLLGYDRCELMPAYKGLYDYEDLLFLYINRDLWGFNV